MAPSITVTKQMEMDTDEILTRHKEQKCNLASVTGYKAFQIHFSILSPHKSFQCVCKQILPFVKRKLPCSYKIYTETNF